MQYVCMGWMKSNLSWNRKGLLTRWPHGVEGALQGTHLRRFHLSYTSHSERLDQTNCFRDNLNMRLSILSSCLCASYKIYSKLLIDIQTILFYILYTLRIPLLLNHSTLYYTWSHRIISLLWKEYQWIKQSGGSVLHSLIPRLVCVWINQIL